MNPQQRIDKITEELRDIYRNTNEGPRLVAEMVAREFPTSLALINAPVEPLRGEIEALQDEIEALQDEIKALQDEIKALQDEG